MEAYVNTNKGYMVVKIDEVVVSMTKEQEEKLKKKFNKRTRVLEWVGGNTYYIVDKKNNRLPFKSSSLEELYEMYKAHTFKLPIPERKCFFHK